MNDTLRLILFCGLGAWACRELYHDLTNPERRRKFFKFLYWYSAIAVAGTAVLISATWTTT